MKLLKGFIRRLLASLLVMILVIGAVACAWYGYRGYSMYKNAEEKYPVENMEEDMRKAYGYTEYEDLPEIYIDAVISAEDKRFEEHNGFDIYATIRALFNDIVEMKFVEGGSTITQQLAKNTYFTQEKKLERKVAEVFVAKKIEKTYSKEEIFEMYVNSIYFGSGYYGIYQASMGYYGKIPSELTDYEAVMLAGLPNAPSVYSLDVNPDLAEKRMEKVLERMVECGKLTQEQADDIFRQGNS